MWAAEHRHLDAVQYLLSKGADPSSRDDVRSKRVVLLWFFLHIISAVRIVFFFHFESKRIVELLFEISN